MSEPARLPPGIVGAFRARMARDAERLDALRTALAGPAAPALADDPRRVEVEEVAHGLVGAGATFGFVEVTAAAEDVERLTGLRPALVRDLDAGYRRLLLLALDRLHQVLTDAV